MSLFSFASLLKRKPTTTGQRNSRQAPHLPVQPRLELLEDRITPTVTDLNTMLTYSTIQGAVTAANAGDTLQVSAGTYQEQVTINKNLTLLGAQAGNNAAVRYSDFTNSGNGPQANPADESIVTPPTSVATGGPPYNDLFLVNASNVIIDGFVFDGNNPSISHNGVQLGGIYIDAQDAITNYDVSGSAVPVSDVVMEYNIIQNFSLSGITLDGGSQPGPAVNNQIENNLITNIGNNVGDTAYDISLFNNGAADIQANTINVAPLFTGLYMQNFSNASNNLNWVGNTITVGQDGTGIAINNVYAPSLAVSVANNTINAAPGVTPTDGAGLTWGISVYTVLNNSTVTLSDNTIGNQAGSGTFDRGIDLWNVPSGETVIGGSIANSRVGIELDSVDPFLGSSSANSSVQVNDVAISGATSDGIFVDAEPLNPNTFLASPNTVSGSVNLSLVGGSIANSGVGVLVETVSAGAYVAQVEISGDTSITGGTTGIEVNGATAAIAFTGANPPASISGQSGDYITLANGALSSAGNPETLDVSHISFGSPGFIGANNSPPYLTATLATIYGIEDKLTDYLDNGTLGYLSLRPGQEFATQKSETTNAGAIARAMNVANTGDTINVQAGTYVQNVNVNKPVTLLGAQAGQSAAARFASFNAAVESVLTVPTVAPFAAAPFNDIFLVTANNVTINGFVLDGHNAALNQSGSTQAGGVNIDGQDGITNYNAAGAGVPISNLVAQNDIIQNFAQSGISLDNNPNGLPPAINSTIQGNVISNIGNNANEPAFGVILYDNAFAAITNNTIILPAFTTALQAQSFVAGTDTMTWSGNTITIGQDGTGIDINLFTGAGSSVNATNNTINTSANVTAGDPNGLTWGIAVLSVGGNATVALSGNTIGNLSAGSQFDRGMTFWNDSTSNPVSVTGGSIANARVGIEVDSVDPFFGGTAANVNSTVNVNGVAISGATSDGIFVDAETLAINTFGASPNTVNGNVSINLNGGSITGSGIGVLIEAPTNPGSYTAQAHISGNVAITGGTTGIKINGPLASLSFTGANPPASISGQSGDYIALANGALSVSGNPLTLDVSQISFGSPGFVGANNNPPYSTATLATFYGIEDKFTDYLYNSTLGYLRLHAGQVFVTQEAETTNAGAIVRGLNVANTGDTVNVQAGTFAANASINKPVTLLGAGSGTSAATNTIIQSAISGTPVITVSSSGVSLNSVNLANTGAGTDLSIANPATGVTLSGISLGGTGLGVNYAVTSPDTLNLANTVFAGTLANYIATSSANAITANGTVFNGDPGATFAVTVTGLGSFSIGYKGNTPVNISSTPDITFNGSATSPESTLVVNTNLSILQTQTGFVQIGTASGTDVAITYSNVGPVNLNNAAAIEIIPGPDTIDRATAFTGLTADQRFVQALYLDDLGRAGAVSELNGWVAFLHSAGGSQALVVSAIEHSVEAQDHLVKSWYLAFLGRAAQNGEELGWVNLLLQGQTEEQVLSDILGNAGGEFFNRMQALYPETTANQSYVQGLYHVLLGRAATTAEMNALANEIPTIGIQAAALQVLKSSEFRTDQFEGYYNALLRRTSDGAGLTAWVNSGLDALTVRIDFESSNEFYTNG